MEQKLTKEFIENYALKNPTFKSWSNPDCFIAFKDRECVLNKHLLQDELAYLNGWNRAQSRCIHDLVIYIFKNMKDSSRHILCRNVVDQKLKGYPGHKEILEMIEVVLAGGIDSC